MFTQQAVERFVNDYPFAGRLFGDRRARALALMSGGQEIDAPGYARQPINEWPPRDDVVFPEAPADWGIIDAIGLVDERGAIYRTLRIPYERAVKTIDTVKVPVVIDIDVT